MNVDYRIPIAGPVTLAFYNDLGLASENTPEIRISIYEEVSSADRFPELRRSPSAVTEKFTQAGEADGRVIYSPDVQSGRGTGLAGWSRWSAAKWTYGIHPGLMTDVIRFFRADPGARGTDIRSGGV